MPATRAEISVVYVAGVVQGIVLVTFPAAVAVAMDLLSFVLARPQHRVRHVHPRPAGHLQAEAA